MHVLDATRLDEQQFASVLELVRAHERRIDPEIEPMGGAELKRLIHNDRTDANRHLRYAALDGGGTAEALGHLELETDDANRHFASAEVFRASGDPEGGRRVLAHMLQVAATDGRTTLLGWGPDEPDEDQFWVAVGADRRYVERISALDMAGVDPDLMEEWIERRSERAGDVELLRWIDRCPAALLDPFAACINALNDAPMEGVEMNDWAVDADDIREDEEANRALGRTMFTLFAVTPQGGPVGYTQVLVNDLRPMASKQWGTAVVDAHRGRGVGRWIKAEMWRWLRAERPEVGRLLTGNAGSNAGMLAINEEMGYRLVRRAAAWQADIPTYLEALE